MEVLAKSDGRIYGAMTIDRSDRFASPFEGLPFPCLIWDHDGRLTLAERSVLARKLLDAGCRYAVCGGENTEAWHDAVDEAWLEKHLDDSEAVRDAAHVMTTSHDGESPDDVAFFFVLNTDFDDLSFERYLVLHVGAGAAKDPVDEAVRKYAVGRG